MMKVQLLFLLALVTPFCAVARPGTTVSPTDVKQVTDAPGSHAATDAPSTEVAARQDMTEAPATTGAAAVGIDVSTEVTHEVTPEVSRKATTKAVTENVTEVATQTVTEAVTEAATMKSEARVTEQKIPGLQSQGVTVESTTGGVEEPDEGIGSGQVVGIVIGALVAVIVLIAVVIVLVRRMGKYSP